MILIIDNNEERRKDIAIWLRMKGYIVSTISFEYMDYYTKPNVTVYINPSNKIVPLLKNTDTISVIFSERKSISFPDWSINIFSLKNIASEIIKIYEAKCPYEKKNEIDVLGYACMKNAEFALGGKIIKLSKREKQLVSLFMFNHSKKFNIYDLVNYFDLRSNPESNILNSIYKLNKKMLEANREKLIIVDKDVCYFNHEISNYICQEYTEMDEDDIDRYDKYRFKKFF